MSAAEYQYGEPIPSRDAIRRITKNLTVLTPTLVPAGLDPMWVVTSQKCAFEMFDWAKQHGYELVAHPVEARNAVVVEFQAEY